MKEIILYAVGHSVTNQRYLVSGFDPTWTKPMRYSISNQPSPTISDFKEIP